ncbi:unnamed protein product [Clavelina lepadiformis]|uniref:Uncharacterized protein n=1 Tax=Clavelina lepadiformis TaxID=159417 RepID=A0ABP0FLE2_CLALP
MRFCKINYLIRRYIFHRKDAPFSKNVVLTGGFVLSFVQTHVFHHSCVEVQLVVIPTWEQSVSNGQVNQNTTFDN